VATAIGNRPSNGQVRQQDDEVNKTFVGFLRAIRSGNPSAIEKQGGRWVEKTDMGENIGMAGGYLVPREYTARFLKPLVEKSFIYRRAHVIPMGALETVGPMLDATTVRAANTTPFFGGLLAQWGAGKTNFSTAESEPQFRQQMLHAWDLLIYALASNQMLQDMGPEADDALLRIFGECAAYYAEWAFINGGGTSLSMPLGMLNAPCAIKVSRNTPSHIKVQDPANMIAQLLPMSWSTAVWAVSTTALADLVQITAWQPNERRHDDEGCVGYLHNLPVFPTSKLPALGTLGDLTLLDPSLYIIGDRMQVTIDVSDQAPYSTTSAFQTNQSMFRVWLRLDGKCMLNNSVTLMDGSSTASSVVILN
jgi:HK97 family phage major capsid protein